MEVVLMVEILSWTATGLSIFANFLIIKKIKWGFIIWNISNIFLITIYITQKNVALIVLFIFYTIMNIWGFIKWNKK